ncbi:hypothetical protein [Actinoplanes sp. TBRC 11911]|uniref:hypothetical protein n=1 Tax=Actinoplanes sp. TBRC 11911 TaxID=2729386 RepID=UPI001B7D4CA6|nr:hypothetical protein [Actinoplanes sp. TBRC 11911]
MRRMGPVVSLFFVAPFVAEFLLGDLPVVMLPVLLAFAPMYGGGALLIREVARRSGRGWPMMLTLALAFAVLEEGLLTQSLFNPNYAGEHLLQYAYIPALGIGGLWTPYVLGIHVLWSMATPIALVEESSGFRRELPWLGRRGLWVTGGLFVVGWVVFFAISYQMSDGFLASPAQLISAASITMILVVVAFALPRRSNQAALGDVPRPWVVFLAAAIAGALFIGMTFLPHYSGLFAGPVAVAVLAVLVSRWAKRMSWGHWHRYALAVAGLFTYAWHAFMMNGVTISERIVEMVSHVVFAVAAAVLAWRAYRRVRAYQPAAVDTAGSAPVLVAAGEAPKR